MAKKVAAPASGFDPFSSMKNILNTGAPWDSIVDFATHKSFCGIELYPRQQTMLKLIYLETENMTAYDVEVISRWAESFADPTQPIGVQKDIWERVEYLKQHGYRCFPHVQAVMGRRAGKGMIGGICGAEHLAYMYSLDDWQKHFGLPDGKDGYVNCIATTQTQAKRFQFADIRQTIERCEYLQPAISSSLDSIITLRTPADERRILRLKKSGVPVDREIASLKVVAASSNSASGRGSTTFANFYDEFAHMLSGTGSVRTSEEVYDGYQPALDQFGKHGFTYMPSSPWSKVGKFYDLYVSGCETLDEYNRKHGLKLGELSEEEAFISAEEGMKKILANPEMLIFQLPSWEPYKDYQKSFELTGIKKDKPIQYEPDNVTPEGKRMLVLEASNPEKFKVERRAQFASVIDAYLNPEKVDQMFLPFWGGRTLEAQNKGEIGRSYRIHIDPASTNADFALCIAHLENPPEPDDSGYYWPHVIVDYLHIWRAEDFPDKTIDYVSVFDDLQDILDRFPSTAKFTSDQWNSAAFISMLKKKYPHIQIGEVTFSDSSNRKRAENFKSALNLGWVHSYKDDLWEGNEGSLLELELKFLSEKNGKVVKPEFGPITKKDLADTLMEVTVDLLQDSLDKWNKSVMDIVPAFGQSNSVLAEKTGIGIQNFSRKLDSFVTPTNMYAQRNSYRGSSGRGRGF